MTWPRIESREAFDRTIHFGTTTESRYLEFKGEYGWRSENKTEQALELCRDVAQFANSDGGVLLIGITESLGTGGRKVASAVRAVENMDGLTNWMEQAIRSYLTPSTFTRTLRPIETANGPILAVNIAPSLHLVALWHKQGKAGIEYLYRTDYGKQWMNPDEVERHLMNASRATRLAVQDVMDQAKNTPAELVPAIAALGHDGNGPVLMLADYARPVLNRCGNRSVSLVVYYETTNKCIEIPYGVIRDAWVTTDGRPGLCLSVRLMQRPNGEITMEPLGSGLPPFD
jgi:hypothetical protein